MEHVIMNIQLSFEEEEEEEMWCPKYQVRERKM